jgi:hypothetical protein
VTATARNIDVSLLPQSLQEIAEVIGLMAVLKLVDRYGGRRLRMPRRLVPGHPLIEVVGQRAAAALVQTYALERIYVPNAARAAVAARNHEIRRRRTTETVDTLAEEFGLHRRRIQQICAED